MAVSVRVQPGWLAAGAAVCLLGIGGMWRLWQLQGMRGWHYQALADQNRLLTVVQRAPRGLIYDRENRIVAGNQVQYGQAVTRDEQYQEDPLAREDALALMATSPATLRQHYVREYPYGPILAPILGYVQSAKLSSDRVNGQMGIERAQQETLLGKDGFIRYERNAHGEATRMLTQQDVVPGSPLHLTIDAELSRVAFDALGDQRGAVIVSDPQTGELLAVVSKPSFVPYHDATDWQAATLSAQLSQDQVAPSIPAALEFPNNPFLFRPVAAVYPPGSVFKIVTALAGLELGAITQSTTVRDEGVLTVGEYTYQNWYWRQFGRTEGDIEVVRALARSNDIFFYKVAEWLGPQKLADFARLFSYGERTGIGIAGEQAGIIPDPQWKQQRFGEQWFLGNTYHMGIGQGDVLVTPIQVHTMMTMMATGGRSCRPRLRLDETVSCSEISLQPASIHTVQEGLREACQPGGTGVPFFQVPYDVLCKTGTAEFGAANEKDARPTHGWFVAAVSKTPRSEVVEGAFQPEIVITVVVESDEKDVYKEGSQDAAPIARVVADWWLAHE